MDLKRFLWKFSSCNRATSGTFHWIIDNKFDGYRMSGRVGLWIRLKVKSNKNNRKTDKETTTERRKIQKPPVDTTQKNCCELHFFTEGIRFFESSDRNFGEKTWMDSWMVLSFLSCLLVLSSPNDKLFAFYAFPATVANTQLCFLLQQSIIIEQRIFPFSLFPALCFGMFSITFFFTTC